MNNKTRSLISYALINSIFAAALVVWVIDGSFGAANIAMFIAWATVAATPIVILPGVMVATVLRGSHIPWGVDVAFDVFVVVCLLISGAFITAGFYMLHAIIVNYTRNEAVRVILKSRLKKDEV